MRWCTREGNILANHSTIGPQQAENSVDPVRELTQSLEFEHLNKRRLNVEDEEPDTCKWLLATPEWKQWQKSFEQRDAPRLLWIKGRPGTGKSTLMKFAHGTAFRAQENEIVLAHFFNARGTELEKSTEGMYRTLLCQLLNRLRPTPEVVGKVLPDGIPVNNSWTLNGLTTLFKNLTLARADKHTFTLFIDALDECYDDQAEAMLKSFHNLISHETSKCDQLRICFASRYYPNMIVPWESNKIHSVRLENEQGHKSDLSTYITANLKIGTEDFTLRTGREVFVRANGVFLWCTLVVTILNKTFIRGRLNGENEVHQVLAAMPDGLHELFDDILAKLNTKGDRLVGESLACFRWVLFSFRPLRARQLWWAIQRSIRSAEELALIQRPDDGNIISYLTDVSGGLVEVLRFQEVQLVHQSVKDFLLTRGQLARLSEQDKPPEAVGEESRAHDMIAKACYEEILSYSALRPTLSNQDHHECPVRTLDNYAEDHMMDHAEAAHSSGMLDQSDLIQKLSFHFDAYRRPWDLFDVERDFATYFAYPQPSTGDLIPYFVSRGLIKLTPVYYHMAAKRGGTRRMMDCGLRYIVWSYYPFWIGLPRHRSRIGSRQAIKALIDVYANSEANHAARLLLLRIASNISCSQIGQYEHRKDREPRLNPSFLREPRQQLEWLFLLASCYDELALFFLLALLPDLGAEDIDLLSSAARRGFRATVQCLSKSNMTLLEAFSGS